MSIFLVVLGCKSIVVSDTPPPPVAQATPSHSNAGKVMVLSVRQGSPCELVLGRRGVGGRAELDYHGIDHSGVG
ncbi:MAG: hypothetical protein HN348_14045 [Proteobacteria bacterium]|nr:hypothetical protein [Pseudomonadota bacterium]